MFLKVVLRTVDIRDMGNFIVRNTWCYYLELGRQNKKD
jgi:hypothetical protein